MEIEMVRNGVRYLSSSFPRYCDIAKVKFKYTLYGNIVAAHSMGVFSRWIARAHG